MKDTLTMTSEGKEEEPLQEASLGKSASAITSPTQTIQFMQALALAGTPMFPAASALAFKCYLDRLCWDSHNALIPDKGTP